MVNYKNTSVEIVDKKNHTTKIIKYKFLDSSSLFDFEVKSIFFENIFLESPQ